MPKDAVERQREDLVWRGVRARSSLDGEAAAAAAAAAAAGHGRSPPNRSSAAVARTAYTAGAGAGALERGPVERRHGAEDRDAVEPRGAAVEVRRHSAPTPPMASQCLILRCDNAVAL